MTMSISRVCGSLYPRSTGSAARALLLLVMKWAELCLRLLLALSLQSAVGYLSPPQFISRPDPISSRSSSIGCRRSSSSSSAAVSCRRSVTPASRRLRVSLRSSGPQSSYRQRCPRPRSLSAAAPSQAAAGKARGQQPRAAWSNTALAAGAGRGSVKGEGDEGADKGGGWRQRVVRTVVSVFLRIRALVAAVGSRLGLSRSTKVREQGTGRKVSCALPRGRDPLAGCTCCVPPGGGYH